jgi:N-carbamoylputrescine amidase
MKRRTLNISLIQQSFSDNLSANREKLASNIAQACAQSEKPQLIVLSELHNGLYFCQQESDDVFDSAESVPGPTSQWLCALAKQHQVVLVGSVFEKTTGGDYYNTALIADSDGHLAGTYHKTHIPYDPGYYEQYYFRSSTDGFHPVDTSIGKLGVLICFDQWFPEAARAMALAGAELLIYPTAIGYEPLNDKAQQQRDREAWITVQRGHAIANCIPVASCNRVGFEAAPDASQSNGINFWGSSFICGPQGEFMAQATDDKEEIITATVDLSRTAELREIWTFLRDRKPEMYSK